MRASRVTRSLDWAMVRAFVDGLEVGMDGSDGNQAAPTCALGAQVTAESGLSVRKVHRHTLANQVSPSKYPHLVGNSCLKKAIDWLDPLKRIRPRAMVKMMPRAVSYFTIWEWMTGRRRLPADIARAMAALVADRAREGLAVEAELLAYAEWREAIPRPRFGAMVVDPATGVTKRGWKR